MIFGVKTQVTNDEMFMIRNNEEVVIDSLFSELSHNLKDFIKYYKTQESNSIHISDYTTYEIRCWVEEMDTLKNKLGIIYNIVNDPVVYDKIRNVLLDKQKITDVSGDKNEISNSW